MLTATYQTQGLTFTLPTIEPNNWREDHTKSTEAYWITKFGIDAHLTKKINIHSKEEFWYVEFDELPHLDSRFQSSEFELAKSYIAGHMHRIALDHLKNVLTWTTITIEPPHF